MELSSVQKKQALKAIKTLKELAPGIFSPSESLLDIEKTVKAVHTSVSGALEANSSFALPVEFTEDFAFFCFSDGACRGNPGPGAWGALVQDSSGELIYEGSGLERPSTNNRMEMTGALRCMQYLKAQGHLAANIVVISDSKYVVDGMNKWVEGWKKRGWKKADKKTPENIEIWKDLDQLRNEFAKVHFSWVKGHAGHPQNERCDQLANEALDNERS